MEAEIETTSFDSIGRRTERDDKTYMQREKERHRQMQRKKEIKIDSGRVGNRREE